MELSKFKHIVTSGCSYGMMAGSITSVVSSEFDRQNKIKKLCGDDKSIPFWVIKNDVIVWDVSLRSQSSDWIADTIERIVPFLLEKGVPSENIYTFCEWTSWDRVSVDLYDWLHITEEDLEIENESNNFGIAHPVILKQNDIFPSCDYNHELHSYFVELNIGCSNGNVGRIGNRFYLTPTHTYEGDFKTIKSKEWHKLAKEYELSVSTETKISNYLNNIIRTQNLLKKYSIQYNFVFMQQSLSAWKRHDDNILRDFTNNISDYRLQFVDNDKIVTNSKFNPIANKSTNIEEVYLPAKVKIKEIDFNNIWFYKNEKYERGGIDEWAIDTFGIGCMVSPYHTDYVMYNNITSFDDILSPHEIITAFGYHPHNEFYKLLWNVSATNCSFFKINQMYKDRLEEMLYEDLEHNGISKNCFLLSRKYLNTLSPLQYDTKILI